MNKEELQEYLIKHTLIELYTGEQVNEEYIEEEIHKLVDSDIKNHLTHKEAIDRYTILKEQKATDNEEFTSLLLYKAEYDAIKIEIWKVANQYASNYVQLFNDMTSKILALNLEVWRSVSIFRGISLAEEQKANNKEVFETFLLLENLTTDDIENMHITHSDITVDIIYLNAYIIFNEVLSVYLKSKNFKTGIEDEVKEVFDLFKIYTNTAKRVDLSKLDKRMKKTKELQKLMHEIANNTTLKELSNKDIEQIANSASFELDKPGKTVMYIANLLVGGGNIDK